MEAKLEDEGVDEVIDNWMINKIVPNEDHIASIFTILKHISKRVDAIDLAIRHLTRLLRLVVVRNTRS